MTKTELLVNDLRGLQVELTMRGASPMAVDTVSNALEFAQQHRWIPVTLRMPKEKYIVLAAVDTYNDPHNCTYALLWVEDGAWTDGYMLVDSVLAWMPLPEIYDGGAE